MTRASTAIAEPVADSTKERLLEAGMQVFAERGFAAANVRQICARAGTNTAAVNYHFGTKQRFYAEVLVSCHRRAAARQRMPRLDDDPERPEAVLRAWIRWFVELLLVESEISPLGRLMAREMFQPTPAFDELIERSMAPMHGALLTIVAALIGDHPRPVLHRATNSVLGQCLLYKHAQRAIERLARLDAELDQAGRPDPAALARHIADFSLAGLARLRTAAGETR